MVTGCINQKADLLVRLDDSKAFGTLLMAKRPLALIE